nr:enoyl-CoA hydratase domain-containing protein 3, mitochondrial isoform X2 [Chelonoidis abingdonii]
METPAPTPPAVPAPPHRASPQPPPSWARNEAEGDRLSPHRATLRLPPSYAHNEAEGPRCWPVLEQVVLPQCKGRAGPGWSQVMTLLQKLPVPVIAKVNGLATAAGCQLVASCDIAVASEKSRFATPGVNIGLFCSTPAVAVGRALSRKVALEMLFTGEPISAHDALLHGLLSRVVPEDKLEEETMKIARKICETSRSVVALGKATFYKQMALDLDAAYKMTSQVMVDNLTLKDGREGIEAFVQKRKPTWSHSVNTACK